MVHRWCYGSQKHSINQIFSTRWNILSKIVFSRIDLYSTFQLSALHLLSHGNGIKLLRKIYWYLDIKYDFYLIGKYRFVSMKTTSQKVSLPSKYHETSKVDIFDLLKYNLFVCTFLQGVEVILFTVHFNIIFFSFI